MEGITKQQYELAERRIEELLPLVDDSTPTDSPLCVELTLMSDIVEEYEKLHYPIAKPTPAELIKLSLDEQKITQKELARRIGVSPTRVNDFVKGKSEPGLSLAGKICHILGIRPEAMLGY
ncbi:type II toxin-antitoxin system HigA family antitoxin [Prevotella sp. kh1p2]|uniref:helix-turn-helix domain-containing protein n=1 Tax=Prevotella sp. kh1p2 TaxID=1761883 RepID=UPI0008CF4A33|nr:helix-turn-helix transcriptional regulator [Prevotella sp. kh1p2]SES71130.1 HTH-type transcriptional regulator / antitoxin HigA [Prevotella sp. kh1p2]SNU10404.1 HTH-type transcriptional regulator / antitoxin HigA [Prevotellaceae bacterium KH2P17]